MSNILYSIDFFKQPFSLLLVKKPLLTTCFGQLVSIAIIVLIINAIVNSGLVLKINPTVVEKSLTLDQGPSILFGDKIVKISVGLLDDLRQPLFDPSIFSIDVYLTTIINSETVSKQIPTRSGCLVKSSSVFKCSKRCPTAVP